MRLSIPRSDWYTKNERPFSTYTQDAISTHSGAFKEINGKNNGKNELGCRFPEKANSQTEMSNIVHCPIRSSQLAADSPFHVKERTRGTFFQSSPKSASEPV